MVWAVLVMSELCGSGWGSCRQKPPPRTPLLGCAELSGGPPRDTRPSLQTVWPWSASEAIPGEVWPHATWLDVAVTSSAPPGWREALHQCWGRKVCG